MSLTNVTLLDTSSSSLDVPEPPLEGTVGPLGGTCSRGPLAPVPELPPCTRHTCILTRVPSKSVTKDEDGSDSGSSAGCSTTPGPLPQLDYVYISCALMLEARDEITGLREQVQALRTFSEPAWSHSAPVNSSGFELPLCTSALPFWPRALAPPDIRVLLSIISK